MALVLQASRVAARRAAARLPVYERGERLKQLLAEPQLERHKRAEKLDYFNEHPIVGRRRHELEKYRRQVQIIVRIFARQLADHVDRRALDA